MKHCRASNYRRLHRETYASRPSVSTVSMLRALSLQQE
jgi:hypothetical protein